MVQAARSLPENVRISGVLCWNQMSIVQAADTSLLIPCSDLRLQRYFSCQMCNLARKNAILEVRISQIPCIFPC